MVIDAYDAAGRKGLTEAGGTRAGDLYRTALLRCQPDAEVEIFAYDESTSIPGGVETYDGIVWTGSSLTIYRLDDGPVRDQIALAREGYDKGVPQFGSCYAAQMAVMAADGECGRNPKGREFGITEDIILTDDGKAHPLFRGRQGPIRNFTSHGDTVTTLPEGAMLLAYNDFTPVQAVAVEHGDGTFWAVQYHPEYNFNEVARIGKLWRRSLIKLGRFADEEDADGYIAALDGLQQDDTRQDLANRAGASRDVIDLELRLTEVRNWLDAAVLPRLGG